MKKIIKYCLLFCLLFCFVCTGKTYAAAKAQKASATSEIISKSSYKVDVVDPGEKTNKKGACYPGFRGGNQLIIYTKDYGAKTTGTNEFGLEAVVKDGYVEEIIGNNAYIPGNGFVISGHGNAKNWIRDNIKEGAVIKFNPETKMVESIITPESYIFKSRKKLNKVKSIALKNNIKKDKNKKNIHNLIKNSETNLHKAQGYMKKKDYANTKTYANIAENYANQALYLSMPYISTEFKGIWHRPIEKNREQIGKTLDNLQQAGIDNVFLETYYQGYTIYPSNVMAKYGFVGQRPEFNGFNPLAVWVEEAHKRNMKVHVWFQCFYCGGQGVLANSKHIITVKPAWANVQKRYYELQTPYPSTAEHNGYFLDPANPEVIIFLKELLAEIANCYGVDGINIDYVRYPLMLNPKFGQYVESNWGYSAYARQEFASMYGKDPIMLEKDDALWNSWIQYRQNKVTSFVMDVRNMLNGKNILLSAVIFPNKEETKIVKLQNWEEWLRNGYVDAVTPLIMGSDDKLAADYTSELKNIGGNRVKVFTGFFEPFTSEDVDRLFYQINSARKAGSDGVMIFDSAHLTNDYVKALNSRIFKKD